MEAQACFCRISLPVAAPPKSPASPFPGGVQEKRGRPCWKAHPANDKPPERPAAIKNGRRNKPEKAACRAVAADARAVSAKKSPGKRRGTLFFGLITGVRS